MTAPTLDAALVSEGAKVTMPGVYDMPAEQYHADCVEGGSLSHSGAKRLLEVPPARWLFEQSQPQEEKEAFDLGTAVHKLVLGAGPDLRVVDADTWQTKAAREFKATAYADGAVPLLPKQMASVQAMADAVAAHPIAAAFGPDRGDPERVMVWRDEQTGVWLRAMVDWMPRSYRARRALIDLKTIHDGSYESVSKAIADHGYFSQAPWYLEGARALGVADADTDFLFVFVEKAPPHLVQVVRMPSISLEIGAARNRVAIQRYAECRASGQWPGYPLAIQTISMPGWAESRLSQEYLK